jgi:hypothetical protein
VFSLTRMCSHDKKVIQCVFKKVIECVLSYYNVFSSLGLGFSLGLVFSF